MGLTLTDHSGNALARFGAAGVKRVLKDPVKCCYDSSNKDYACVWCEEAETYIVREGVSKVFTLTLIYWKSANADAKSIEEDFTDLDKAVTKFLKLCKRNPLYADNP